MQTVLARQGADGCVDKLVLNAIAQYGDAETAWRAISSGQFYWGAWRLTVYATDGHVRCHGGTADQSLSWNRSEIRLHGYRLPETWVAELRGRPVTSLLEHPALSDDMIITDVSHGSKFGSRWVSVRFDQPLLLFCSASGRYWPADPEVARELWELKKDKVS